MVKPEPERAANIFDVARLAGVSHQTVSRVINNLPNVRPATQERVEKAMAQLRYSPSPAARALVTRRTRSIGFISPSNVHFGPVSIAMHFNHAARAARYSVNRISTVEEGPDSVRESVDALLRQRVDAIAIMVADHAVLELVRGLDLAIPMVAAASAARRGPNLVAIDQYRGARSAVRHLAELGHKRIIHAAGPAQSIDATERLRGWRDELSDRGLQVVEPRHGDWSAASGYALGVDLDVQPGTAIFVGNDQMAIGMLSALRVRGIRVPHDVSIVGFDDIPEAGYLDPPLTTVRQDFEALGKMMMQKVLVRLEESDSESSDIPLPTQLIERSSTRLSEISATAPGLSPGGH